MNIDIKSEDITPRRHTFSHIAARYGEDRPASRYDEATLDVQATANFHYRPLWQPQYEIFDTDRTAVVMNDWYEFRDPRQFYYATYNISRSGMNQAADRAFDLVEDKNLVARIDADWLETVKAYLIPLRHYEWGANLNSLRVTDFGYGTRLTSALCFAAGDRLGMAQVLTRVGLELGSFDESVLSDARQQWLDAEMWQPTRQMVEDSLVVEDWFETFIAQYLGMDGILLPLTYRVFDDAGMDRGGMAVTMMSEFMTDWMADAARWVDSFVTTAAGESEANAALISGWYRDWRDRAKAAATPIATATLGDASAVDTVAAELDARATGLGLTV